MRRKNYEERYKRKEADLDDGEGAGIADAKSFGYDAANEGFPGSSTIEAHIPSDDVLLAFKIFSHVFRWEDHHLPTRQSL